MRSASRNAVHRSTGLGPDYRMSSGMSSACASIRSSTIETMSLVLRVAAGIGVEHRRLIHQLARALDDRADGELHHVQERAVEREALGREAPDARRTHAPPIHRHRHFDARVLGETVDELLVPHVAVELGRRSRLDRPDEPGRELVVPLELDRRSGIQRGLQLVPLLQVVLAPAEVLVDGDPEPFDLVVVREEPRDVFGAVFGALGGEVPEPLEQLDADATTQTLGVGRDDVAEPRVQVLARHPVA